MPRGTELTPAGLPNGTINRDVYQLIAAPANNAPANATSASPVVVFASMRIVPRCAGRKLDHEELAPRHQKQLSNPPVTRTRRQAAVRPTMRWC
jgi:hypothetical protein